MTWLERDGAIEGWEWRNRAARRALARELREKERALDVPDLVFQAGVSTERAFITNACVANVRAMQEYIADMDAWEYRQWMGRKGYVHVDAPDNDSAIARLLVSLDAFPPKL